MSRWRVTIRGEGVELRGYADLHLNALEALSQAMIPYGLVIASPADDYYDPFAQWEEDA